MGKKGLSGGYQSETPATVAFEKVSPGSTCFEYYIQKIQGMMPEETVLLAIALDFHTGKEKSPLVGGEVSQIATREQENGAMTFIRILIVLDK